MTQTKEQAQIQLQNALTTTFLANLAFLSEYDNELYQRVDELSRMIEQGTYKEKYALEFVMENGDFDIYDIVNDKYMYDRNPKKKNDELVRKIELDAKSSIINIENYFYENIDFNRLENKYNINTVRESSISTYLEMKEYQKVIKNTNFKQNRLKSINKLVFGGVLLGRHIPRIAKKVNAKFYFVFEKNLEIFRLSLFTVDYKVLSKNGLIFSVMDNKKREKEKIEQFLKTEEANNYLIKISTTNINIEEFIDNLLSYMVRVKPTVYDYNRILYVYFNRTTYYIKNQYRFINFDSIAKNTKLFNNTPVLFIAGGPSLNDNLEWLKNNHKFFYIVTIGSVFNQLIKSNIHIDLIVTFDEDELLSTLQFNDADVNRISDKTVIFASSKTHKSVLNKFNKDNLFLYETYHGINQQKSISGPSVGDIAINILMRINVKELYLLGLDLAINQETGATHSSETNSVKIHYDLSLEKNRDTFSLREGLVKVKGNFLNEVYTNSSFSSSIDFIDKNIMSQKDESINVYNLSGQGAYLSKTIPTKITEVNSNRLLPSDLNKEFFSILEEHSIQGLHDERKEFVKQIIRNIDMEIKKLLIEFNTIYFNTFDDFLMYSYNFIYDIKKYDNFVFTHCLKNYYNILLPYLIYHFNDIKVKNEKNKVEKIKVVFTRQIEILLEDYSYFLNRLI